MFAAALLPRLACALAPLTFQLRRFVPDDAYYYPLTARHWLAGGGPSVDGVNASNGWHPLWMLLNVAVVGSPISDADAQFRLLLACGAVLDAATAVVLFQGARRFVGAGWAAVGALFYASNSVVVMQSVNGLETPLVALGVALAWRWSLRVVDTARTRDALAWGAVFGLAFLARTDAALTLVGLGCYVVWKLPRAARVRCVGAGAAVAVVVVLPWLVWNHVEFGSAFVQQSAHAAPRAMRAEWHEANPGQSAVWHSVDMVLSWRHWLLGPFLGGPPWACAAVWALAAVGIVRAPAAARPLRNAACLLIAGGGLLAVVHAGVRWFPREWYFVVMSQAMALGIALLGARRVRWAPALTGVVLIAHLVGGLVHGARGHFPWQERMLETAHWVRDNTRKDAVVGAFNSGILGWYAERRVVNLDGVVNPQALRAIESEDLAGYAAAEGISVFADADLMLTRYGRALGPLTDALHEVWSVPADAPFDRWRVYTISR